VWKSRKNTPRPTRKEKKMRPNKIARRRLTHTENDTRFSFGNRGDTQFRVASWHARFKLDTVFNDRRFCAKARRRLLRTRVFPSRFLFRFLFSLLPGLTWDGAFHTSFFISISYFVFHCVQ
jgi:hypothetical protein